MGKIFWPGGKEEPFTSFEPKDKTVSGSSNANLKDVYKKDSRRAQKAYPTSAMQKDLSMDDEQASEPKPADDWLAARGNRKIIKTHKKPHETER